MPRSLKETALLESMMSMAMAVGLSLLGAMLGLWIGWRLGHKSGYGTAQAQALQQVSVEEKARVAELAAQAARLQGLQEERAALGDKLRELESVRIHLEGQNASLKTALDQKQAELTQWTQTLEAQWHQQFEAFLLKSLGQAQEQFHTKANETYTEKQLAFDTKLQELLKPLTETVQQYKKEVEEIQKQHHTQSSLIKEEVFRLNQATTGLYQALSHNKGRGNWGEVELLRLLEDSGFVEGIGYVQQKAIGSERKRPDIRINLPDHRVLFVDAKALQVDPHDIPTPDESAEQIRERQKRYARSLDEAVKLLSSKEYQAELSSAADFVILYVPRESILANALAVEPDLFEKAYRLNVMLAGPFNLIALLKIVHHSWVMARLSDQTQQILTVGTDLQKQAVVFTEHFEKVVKNLESLNKSVDATWKSFTGSRGFVKQVKKLEGFGCKSAKSMPDELAALETRALPHGLPELDLEPEAPVVAGFSHGE